MKALISSLKILIFIIIRLVMEINYELQVYIELQESNKKIRVQNKAINSQVELTEKILLDNERLILSQPLQIFLIENPTL